MKLWAHQEKALSIAANRYALFFDPGCGKSRTAIELYKKSRKHLHRGGATKGKTLIIAPLNVVRNWENELKEYLGAPYKVFLVGGQSKLKKIRILEEFKDSIENLHQFLIVNTEALRGKEYRQLLMESGASFIIVDESHMLKTHNSQQTLGLFDVVKALSPTHLYLLTGTPAPQGEIDLWSTFTLLGQNSESFFVWRRRFFIDKNERRRGTRTYFPDYSIAPKSRELFQKLLSECSMTARKDEVLDLPELLRTNIYSELSPEQKRHYDTMREYLFAIDKDGDELNANNMLVRTLRLQQISAGFIGDKPISDNPRLKALLAAIDKTTGAQFIIWTIFKATYGQIGDLLDSLGISFGRLTGEDSAEDRHEAMNAFQAGELRALIAHPRAGGVGVNLTAASYSIHYTRSYSLVDDLQAEARNYRGGSERHERITRIDIITPDTIDEDIAKALREKKSVQEFILGLKASK